MYGWRSYIRLFLGQMRDRTVPFRERWLRAHRMGLCGRLIVNGYPYRPMRWLKLIAAINVLPLLAGCGLPGLGGTAASSPLSAQVDTILANYALYRKLELGMLAVDQSPVVMSVPGPVVVTPNAPGTPPVVVTPVPAPTLPGPVVVPNLRQQRHGERRPASEQIAKINSDFWSEHPPSFRLVAGKDGQTAATAMLNAEQLK